MDLAQDLERRGGAEQRRMAILRAAARCLAEIGYDRVRLRDISHESGVSVGLIQHYFETRDSLLKEAFDFVSDELIAKADAAAEDGDPWQRIVALVESLAGDDDLRRHCVIWTQYCVVASREPAMRAGVGRIYAVWRGHVEEAVRAGIGSGLFTPALDVDAVIDVLVTQVDGCELAVTAGYQGVDAARLRELVLATAAVLLGYDAGQRALTAARSAASG